MKNFLLYVKAFFGFAEIGNDPICPVAMLLPDIHPYNCNKCKRAIRT